MSTVAIQHYLYGPGQTGVPRRRCTVTLTGLGLWLANETGEIIDQADEDSDDTGLVTFTLTPNAEIAGPDSYYTFRISGTPVARAFIAPVSGAPVNLVDCLVDETTLDPVDPDLPSLYLARAERGAVNGVAPLGADGKVPAANLPEASGGSTPDATALINGVVRLAGDLSGTAAAPTVPGLAMLNPARRWGCVAMTMLPHDLSDVEPKTIALTASRLYAFWLPVPPGTVIAGVKFPLQALAVGPGAVEFGVYQADLTRLGTTGDVAAALTTGSAQVWRTVALTAAAAVTGAGVWLTAHSTCASGPNVLFADTNIEGWVFNPADRRTTVRVDGAAAPGATLDLTGAVDYLDFCIGITSA
ncbi:hypothetical protein SAMN04488074_10596 [Lentzea albidocapillata subsp. violacea]|uniref:Uncharacterized protein n=1 Tax=Lentzea albidocapillata subsp. violacea TaxID=128104 RepID=A0A1G9ASK4_9PSEU|nr:hypothetical protein [Lentzea albidocapillata]SDK29814.1 hypothetical protein SAMN04488074_10596 [Lentzea albidocapillata subsp. violacea]